MRLQALRQFSARHLGRRHRLRAVVLPMLVASVLATALAVPGLAAGTDPIPARLHHSLTVRPAAAPATQYTSPEGSAAEQAAIGAQVGIYANAVLLNQFLDGADRLLQEQFAQAVMARRHSSGGAATSSGGSGRCGGDVDCFLACTRAHESDSAGGYSAVGGGGRYRGAYQFDQQTWDSNAAASGRTDLVGQDPAAAPPAAQDQVAADTYSRRGNQAWGGLC